MAEVLAPGDPRIPRRRAGALGLAVDGDRRRPLWVEGRVEALGLPAIGIVGTRRPSAHGLAVARQLATVCVQGGWAVVSGMALGIDAAAHEAALAARGVTIGVLPSPAPLGLRQGARPLAARLLQLGALVSDRAIGTPAAAWSFAERNSLLAALCDGVIVVEAPVGSGALLTAEAAADQGTPLAFASAPFGSERAAGGLAWLAGLEPCLPWGDRRQAPTLLAGPGDLGAWLSVCALSVRADSGFAAGQGDAQMPLGHSSGLGLPPGGLRSRLLGAIAASGAAGVVDGDLAAVAGDEGAALAAALALLARQGLAEQRGGRWRAIGGAVLGSSP